MDEQDYYLRFAAAFVRGKLCSEVAEGNNSLFTAPLDHLTIDEMQALARIGIANGLRLHRFKRTQDLPRVRLALGILKSLQPENLLDIGSGRGAFLWPLLTEFPYLPTTCIDILPHRVENIEAMRRGGLELLTGRELDVTELDYADRSFDVVTMLEVLEHIPNTVRALSQVCRVARRAVVISVPSRADDNPEHIHLFDQATLINHLMQAGAIRVNVSHVLNHRVAVASLPHASP